MARLDKSALSELVSHMSMIADTIVRMLVLGQSRAAQALRSKLGRTQTMKLKISLTLLGLELKNSITRNRILAENDMMNMVFEDVATKLESIIDIAYIETFLDKHHPMNDRSPYSPLKTLGNILVTPPNDFSIERCINTDMSIYSSLIIVLQKFMNLVNSDIPDDHEQAHEDSMLAGKPPPLDIKLSAFEGPESIRVMAQCLHETLHSYWPCQLPDHRHDGSLGECHQAYLGLNPSWILSGENMKEFFVILQGGNMQQQCRVRFMSPETEYQPHTRICEIEFDDTQEGCLPLLFNSRNQLWDDDDDLLPRNELLSVKVDACMNYETLSLRDLLTAHSPTFVAKRIIEIIIARSLLILIEGSWMGLQHCLSLDNIHIYCQVQGSQSQASVPYFTEIFVSNPFGRPSSTDSKPIGRFSHPFPAIQALGILLADIERGISPDTEVDNEHKGRNTARDRARETLEIIADTLGSGSGVYQAINFCLDRKSFGRYAGPGRDARLHDPEFVIFLYENIVRPLETDLNGGGNWSWDRIHWRGKQNVLKPQDVTRLTSQCLPSHPKTGHMISNRRDLHVRSVESVYVANPQAKLKHTSVVQISQGSTQCFDTIFGSSAGVDKKRVLSERWFTELKDVHSNLNSDKMDDLDEHEICSLIKVAILDTGVDLTHPELARYIETGRLTPGKDFVQTDTASVSDSDGHGTHTCHTLLKTAPYARVYPVRVFRTQRGEENTPSLVAEAIRHAVQEWNVDIISMSFSFNQQEKEIKEAIRFAHRRGDVLIFAAASNNSALREEPVGYPARDTEHVICVNSSTINAEKSFFSPHGLPGQPNFSAIGEDIVAAWPQKHCQDPTWPYKVMSGTSCATPIAAGVAALILDFSRMDHPQLRSHRRWNKVKDELWETQGMRSVLKSCMTDKNGKYNFIKPWLLKDADVGGIASRLADALEHKHRYLNQVNLPKYARCKPHHAGVPNLCILRPSNVSPLVRGDQEEFVNGSDWSIFGSRAAWNLSNCTFTMWWPGRKLRPWARG